MPVKDKRVNQYYANYEQQAPDRQFYFRHANQYDTQNNYGAQSYDCGYDTQRAHDPHIIHQPNMTQRFIASYYQNKAETYNGRTMPSYQQLDYTGTHGIYNNTYDYEPVVNYDEPQEYSYEEPTCEREDYFEQQPTQQASVARVLQPQRPVMKAKKRTMNSSMIKIVVAVMVVALLICGLLIANQFMSGNEAAAESDIIQSVDSVVVASASSNGVSEALPKLDVLPEYEYEESTNWFDKFCDFFSNKLK